MTTSNAPCLRQNAASALTPSASLSNVPKGPSGPIRASSFFDATSTPQMILVTVTCLVRATVNQPTVRSCVTTAAVPMLRNGCRQRRHGSAPPRERADGHPLPRNVARITRFVKSQIQGAPKGPRRTLVGPAFSAINRRLAQPTAQAETPFEATLRFAPQGEVGGLHGESAIRPSATGRRASDLNP